MEHTLPNSSFVKEEHLIPLLSPCMIYTGPCFITGKMQKLPSPIKQIYSLNPFKQQRLFEKSFN